MNNQSKSRLFTVYDGTLVLAEIEPQNSRQDYRQPRSVIDNKYEILGLVGEGGMGAVYRVRHLLLNKEVALKTFRTGAVTHETRLRFQREAQAIAKLSLESVVQVFDFGLCEDGVPYYTMEYLAGRSLADRIAANGPLSVAEAIKLFVPICQALAIAHSKGIIHRDLKPENIFLVKSAHSEERAETGKLVDFGIACLTDSAAAGQRLTSLGIIFGSPLYMSPEQSTGERVTLQTDIYSLGCTLFESLVGTPPYRGKNALETIMMHHEARLPSLRQASGGISFPGALERLLSKMLAKKAKERQPDMLAVADELRQLSRTPGGNDQETNRPVFSEDYENNWNLQPGQIHKGTGRLLIIVLSCLFLIGAAAGIAVLNPGSKGQTKQGQTEQGQPHNSLAGEDPLNAPIDKILIASRKARRLPTDLSSATNDYENPFVLIKQRKFAQAEMTLKHIIETQRQTLGPDCRELAESMETLAFCYQQQGRLIEAERLYDPILAIYQKHPRENDQQLARTLLFKGTVCETQGRRKEAEQALKRALAIDEKALGANDLVVADILFGLGTCHIHQGKVEKGKAEFRRAIAIFQAKHLPQSDQRLASMRTMQAYIRNGVMP